MNVLYTVSRKKKYKEFKSGVYRPKNFRKFGETSCVYRSSYELDFLKWCDNNKKVLQIHYEKVVIPYKCKTDEKIHKYYVDCKIKYLESSGPKTYLIEIKPFKQTLPPKPSKRKKRQTIITEQYNWLKNTSKWTSAKQYCKSKGWRWCIMTERGMHLDGKFLEIDLFGKR